MVRLGRAPFTNIEFDVASRARLWRASSSPPAGTPVAPTRAAFPGATATAGTTIEFSGNDIMRIANGMITEYWTSWTAFT